MITIRRSLPVAAALALALASCGGSSDGADDDVETPPSVAETVADDADDSEDFTEAESSDADAAADTVEDEPAAPEESEAAEEPAASEPATAEEPEPERTDEVEEPALEPAAGAAIDVSLSEWAISAPTEYTAGEITFNASNGGSFPHEFVVIEGEGYESLPLAEGGAVIEDELPTGALIGRTGRLGEGSTEALTVTLAPGNYVLVCNLGGGTNSHAGKGQRLDVTVS